MAKKKNQTLELNKAALELLKWNESEKARFEELAESVKSQIPRDVLEKSLVRPAVVSYLYKFHAQPEAQDGLMYDITGGEKWEKALVNMAGDWDNPEKILNLLTYSDPEKTTLLLSIDLARSKETILAEVENCIDLQRGKLKNRLKWVSNRDKFFQVWKMWEESGEPARQAFPAIAKRLNVPKTTVKARWYLAYELIYGEPYETDPAKRREQREKKATRKLCGKCTNPICDPENGGDWIGCPDYVKLVGKNTPRERTNEDIDTMADMQAYKAYLLSEYNESKDD